MNGLKFLGVFVLGVVVGAGGLIVLARSGNLPIESASAFGIASAADNYNLCVQDAGVGMFEHGRNVDGRDVGPWVENAMAKCAKQYRIDRQNGR